MRGARRLKRSHHPHQSSAVLSNPPGRLGYQRAWRAVGRSAHLHGAPGRRDAGRCVSVLPARTHAKLVGCSRRMTKGEKRGNPYRAKPPALAPRTEDLRWRSTVSRGVILLLLFLALKGPALAILQSNTVGRASSWIGGALVESLVVWATWLFTTPRETDAGWTERVRLALRYLAILGAVAAGFDSTLHLPVTDYSPVAFLQWIATWLLGVVLNVFGMLYVGARLAEIGLGRSARRARLTGLALGGLAVYGLIPLLQIWSGGFRSGSADADAFITRSMFSSAATLVAMVLALTYTLRLRRALNVVSAEWWLDAEQLPEVHWASYVVLGDGRAEVLLADGESERFLKQREALEWLDEEGFVPVEVAEQEELVDRVPQAISID